MEHLDIMSPKNQLTHSIIVKNIQKTPQSQQERFSAIVNQ